MIQWVAWHEFGLISLPISTHPAFFCSIRFSRNPNMRTRKWWKWWWIIVSWRCFLAVRQWVVLENTRMEPCLRQQSAWRTHLPTFLKTHRCAFKFCSNPIMGLLWMPRQCLLIWSHVYLNVPPHGKKGKHSTQHLFNTSFALPFFLLVPLIVLMRALAMTFLQKKGNAILF